MKDTIAMSSNTLDSCLAMVVVEKSNHGYHFYPPSWFMGWGTVKALTHSIFKVWRFSLFGRFSSRM